MLHFHTPETGYFHQASPSVVSFQVEAWLREYLAKVGISEEEVGRKNKRKRQSKVVSTHRTGTHPEQPLPTGYEGIPFMVVFWGFAWGVLSGCVVIFLETGVVSFPRNLLKYAPHGPGICAYILPKNLW